MACFPGLGPSERHTTTCVLCLLVDQKLALRWTDISREKALFLLRRNYSGPPPYAEATPQSKTPPSGLLGGDPTRVVDRSSPFEHSRRASWMGISGVCTFPLLYHVLDLRTFHSISCLSLLLTRNLFRSCPGLLDVIEQGRHFSSFLRGINFLFVSEAKYQIIFGGMRKIFWPTPPTSSPSLPPLKNSHRI